MTRGEVWWARMGPPRGLRPVLLLSRERAYRTRTAVTVAPITRTTRSIPVEVRLDQADGMAGPCVVNLDDLITIPMGLLYQRVTALGSGRMAQVAAAIVYALALDQDLRGSRA